ncbi:MULTISPECIES: NADH-quinone oxidoreductase subunit C [Acidiplasma]|jgi:NADH-quinone oxidoreductase subunit C|uniref:NADH dehydrogenase n=2 Tax=Acidiplasma TaxID=507753 RepID=A0A0Q0VNH7_9ARCH|nr:MULTISPECIES: NADH-quinone oxidoreductase subunit C [Acidiplasma]KJE49705.1 NADH dehydrogenase [Acidiplasma sp. MBA-1]KPV45956.1 NADH dehydrogenase [Acidiplasma aeolicum]KQB34157.1 NADH dehydrogenase [Acidiplasma aeolicum]KQB35031.1 NADH dehydrogenase [Acidiplasma cupricumulans]WMT55646.1 MAG: NADH-quinone oxidoreductase subunit C [Acidiplasma sp.]
MYNIIADEKDKGGMRVITLDKKDLIEAMTEFKSQGYYLSSITGVDMKDHLEVIYHLHNFDKNEYLGVKVLTYDSKVPSLVGLWKAADWDEREQYDLMGIIFEGHENLRRILLPDEWVGHPLRKDYDLKKVQYVSMDSEGNEHVSFDEREGW